MDRAQVEARYSRLDQSLDAMDERLRRIALQIARLAEMVKGLGTHAEPPSADPSE